MRTVPIVEQPQQQRILQLGQSIQKTVPRLVTPSHVTTVQTNPMPRVRATRPRLAGTVQQSPRMVTQSPVRVSVSKTIKFMVAYECEICASYKKLTLVSNLPLSHLVYSIVCILCFSFQILILLFFLLETNE